MIPILFLTNWREGDVWNWPKEVCCKQSEKIYHKTKFFSLSNFFRLAEYVHTRQKKKNIWLSKSWWLKCHKNNSFNQRQSYTKLKQIDVVKHFIFVEQPRSCKNLKLHGAKRKLISMQPCSDVLCSCKSVDRVVPLKWHRSEIFVSSFIHPIYSFKRA